MYIPGAIAIFGTIVHLYRNNQKITFNKVILIHTLINIGIVFTIGVLCQDYFNIKSERLIWVFSGVACSFSTYLLNLVQLLITDVAPDVARKIFGVDKHNED